MKNFKFLKSLKDVKREEWILLIAITLLFLICSCEQKDLCYDHAHASNVRIVFDWQHSPEANPSSMYICLSPTVQSERTIKREFIGKDGGMVQTMVGVGYSALGFNSNIKNMLFRSTDSSLGMEAHLKDADMIEKIGLPSSQLPRAKDAEAQRMCMEADSLWSASADEDVYVSVEDNDNGIVRNSTISPLRRFCTYRVRIFHVENQDKISSSVAGSITGLAGGINLSSGRKTDESVTIPFAVNLKEDNSLEGIFQCFGNSTLKGATNHLVIYTVLQDGTKWCYQYDITKQICEAPDPFNVEIVLDKLPVPDKINGNSGFIPGVSGWNVIDIPINM